jgi:hypothetical protein
LEFAHGGHTGVDACFYDVAMEPNGGLWGGYWGPDLARRL